MLIITIFSEDEYKAEPLEQTHILSLVKVFEELELNEIDSIKIREAERNIFIRRFNYFRDLIKKLMGLG